MAGPNRTENAVDVSEKLSQDGDKEEHEGVVAALYKECKFYREGHTEGNVLENEDIYGDLGSDPIEQVEQNLQDWIKEARTNGSTEEETKK